MTMKTLRSYLSVCAFLICAVFTVASFSSCGDDDEESSESVTSSSLVDRTFTCDNSYVNDFTPTAFDFIHKNIIFAAVTQHHAVSGRRRLRPLPVPTLANNK